MTLKILNSKEVKEIRKKILDQWGFDFKTDFAFLQSQKNKIYLVSKDIGNIDYEKLRLQVVGNYFGEIMKNGELRLSIEGSQIIGPQATKNVLEIEDVKSWLFGNDLKISMEDTGFMIIKNNDDFLGSGKIKDNTLLNFVPKVRRISNED